MLWRFGLQHASNIDKLLDKEDLTLEEVLNDMDLMQEIREQNPKVISYLVQPHNMKQMVDYIATEEFFKFAKMASTAAEVLCSHSIAFADALVAEYVPRDLIDSDEESSDNEDRPPAASASAAAGPGSSSLSPPDAAAAIAEASPALPPPPRQRLLDQLWGIMRLSAGQVDAGQATLFSRVMCCLLQRKPYQTLDFIRAQDGAVAQFLEHLAMSPIVDLLLKVISLEELDSGPGVTAWLSERRLVPMLVDRMAPDWDPETHSLAAQVLLDIIAISQCNNPTQPTIGTNLLIAELKSEATVTRLADYMLDRTAANATSTLINCVYIFIELIRRNYSDAETAYAHQQSYDGTPDEFGQQPQHQQQPHQGSDDDDEEEEDVEEEDGVGGDDADEDQQASLIPPPPQQQQQQQLPRQLPTVDLSDMMRVLALRVGDLADLLKNPRSPTAPVPTTQGPCEPLGFERLRICELFAELLHCSNMPRLNAMPGSSGRDDAALQCDSPTAESGTTTPQLQQHYSTSAAADHDTTNTPVGQLLKWKLVEHAVLPECMDLFFRFPLNNFLHSVVYDIMHQVLNLPLSLDCNVTLIVVAFRDVRITSRIAQASARNDEVCRNGRGSRLEFMGHLTGVGEEVARLLELLGAALEPLIAPYVDADEWLEYVVRALQEARERDQHPLGGERPGIAVGIDNMVGGDVDLLEADSSSQVFVSRMGLVDPSMRDAYDDEDLDEEDLDDEDEDDEDGDDEGGGGDGGRAGRSGELAPHSGRLYPNEEDDAVDYISSHSSLYFGRRSSGGGGNGSSSGSSGSGGGSGGLHPMVADDEDQFIIHDVDDYDTGDVADDIGPADSIGRYHSYQNEQVAAAVSSDEEGEDADNASPKSDFHVTEHPAAAALSEKCTNISGEQVDDEDSDDASEAGRMDDFLRSREADAADVTRESSDGDRYAGDDIAKAAGLSAFPGIGVGQAEAHGKRRSLLVPSAEEEEGGDESNDDEEDAVMMNDWEVTEDASFGTVQHIGAVAPFPSAAPGISQSGPPPIPPPMPPRLSDADCSSFQSALAVCRVQPLVSGTYDDAVAASVAEPNGTSSRDAVPRPKGRVHDLLFRESKQRSLSSSELDNIVPADIGSWGPPPTDSRQFEGHSLAGTVPLADPSSLGAGLTGDSGSDGQAGRDRSESFAGRRRRSRSQSAGVGISRAMVIQAAVKGQFPYLDAKTCEFVGQLKSDTVTLGGAAAKGSRDNSRTRVAPAVPPLPLAAGSPSMKPVVRDDDAIPSPHHQQIGRPSSGLRLRASAIASDSDDDSDDAMASSSAAAAPAVAPLSAFPGFPPVPPPAATSSSSQSHDSGDRRGTAKQPHKPRQQPKSQEKRNNGRPTYAAVANGTGMSAVPTPTITTSPKATMSSPSWATVASASSANGRGRGPTARLPAMPEFPMLPMSPVHASPPSLLGDGKSKD